MQRQKKDRVESFLFSLALHLGYPHPDYLLPYLSASQLNDWLAFHNQHNLSIDRTDVFDSTLLAMTFNINRGEHRPANATDFIPWYDDDDITYEQFKAKLGY